MITARVYRRGEEIVVAACDKDLLGKMFREGELHIEVVKDFYEGEDVDEETLVNRLSIATIANLVGELTVGIAIRHNFINEECVLRIAGVPHAQMVRI
ncbi:MAG: DUF424 family protein [Methanomassiliicoccales archaeon]|nr:DUF424 family protein [Methanomassiliicoccales archaeon]